MTTVTDRSTELVLIVALILLSLMCGIAIASEQTYLITLGLTVLALGFVLANPEGGIILLLVLLQFTFLFPNVEIGEMGFSMTTIPALGLATSGVLRRKQMGGLKVIPQRWQVLLVLVLLFTYTIVTLLSTYPARSIRFFPNLILYILILIGVLSTVRTKAQLVRIVKTVLVLGFIMSFWREMRFIRGPLGLPGGGINGAMFTLHPAVGIGLVALLSPKTLPSNRWRIFAIVVAVACLYRMIDLEARAAWIAVLVMILLATWRYGAWGKAGMIALSFLAILALTTIGHMLETNWEQTQRTIEGGLLEQEDVYVSSDDQIRLVARDAALKMFAERPLFGWGPGMYLLLKPRFARGEARFVNIKQAFNAWNTVLAEMGLLGLSASLLVFLVPLVLAWKLAVTHAGEGGLIVFGFALGVLGLAIHLSFIDLFFSFVWMHVALLMAATGIVQSSLCSKWENWQMNLWQKRHLIRT
jgi:O-antigen ligase